MISREELLLMKMHLESMLATISEALEGVSSLPMIAAPISNRSADDDLVLRALDASPRASFGDIAKALEWFQGKERSPYKMKVRRIVDRLEREKLIVRNGTGWLLTPHARTRCNIT